MNLKPLLNENEICYAVIPTRRVSARIFILGLQQNGVEARRLAVHNARVTDPVGRDVVAPNATFFAVSKKLSETTIRYAKLFGVKIYSLSSKATVEVK